MLKNRAWNGDHIKVPCFLVPKKKKYRDKHDNQIDLILTNSLAQIEEMTKQS